MDIKEVYYSALVDYRKQTLNNKECVRQRKLIGRANAEIDEIDISHNEVEIDDDWIDAIETGLDFIDKAIKEERQFILSNGEVLPIEKVKNVSVESVEHLAKHSNLLTREPEEGKDLIPDKLYSVERLTDYSVYENRFLYMLLCYLRDFISRRYDDLVKLTTTYEGKLKLNKTISGGNRQTVISINLDETLKNDQYLHTHNSSRNKIKKINLLLNAVLSFLSTPLMEAVSSAPMIKPPITETNVLKMNKNFKGAVKLYYFITAYDKPGYSVKKIDKKIKPFKEAVADEFAEVVELCSFLTYEHGLGITSIFKEEYEQEQQRLAEIERQKKLEQLKALRRRIKENGGEVEDYLLMLEQRNRFLETDNAQLLHFKSELSSMAEKNDQLQKELVSAQKTAEQLNTTIIEKDNEIVEIKLGHKQEIDNLNFETEQKIIFAKKELEAEREKIQNECQLTINNKQTEFNGLVEKLNSEHKESFDAMSEKLASLDNRRVELEKSLEEQTNRTYVAEARINALKKESGLYDGTEDYNSNFGFDELEKQYICFKKLFKEEWKKTKRLIREQYLKVKSTNGKKGETTIEEQTTVDEQVPVEENLTPVAVDKNIIEEPTVEETVETAVEDIEATVIETVNAPNEEVVENIPENDSVDTELKEDVDVKAIKPKSNAKRKPTKKTGK